LEGTALEAYREDRKNKYMNILLWFLCRALLSWFWNTVTINHDIGIIDSVSDIAHRYATSSTISSGTT